MTVQGDGWPRAKPSQPFLMPACGHKYTSRFKRINRREKSGVLGKRLDALLNLVLRVVRNIFA